MYPEFSVLPFFLMLVVPAFVSCQQQQIHRKFEYKHSFRGPNLAQRDGTVPFWDIMGDAMASSEQLRLVPSMRSKKGAAWSKKPMTESEWWEAEITIKVTGQGRIGADGLVFWFTANHGSLGHVFGSNDYWNGLAVILDSFDNDAQRNNPYISMMINDGTRSYDHQTDGSSQMLTGCQKDYRNRPFPVKLKVEYIRNVVQVFVHDGMTQHDRYELCMRSENLFLPKNGYFGLSAATGGLADDHDILAFNVFSLLTEAPKQHRYSTGTSIERIYEWRVPFPCRAALWQKFTWVSLAYACLNPCTGTDNFQRKGSKPGTLPQEEQKKYEQEFEEQWKQFEEEKFQKEHPEKVRKPVAEEFEDIAQRELRLIYESQNAIHKTIQQLEMKLGQIIQQQNTHTQMLSQAGRGSAVQQQPGGVPVDTFQRHEVNEVIQLSREMSGTLREMRTHLNDVYSRTINMEQRLNSGAGVASVQHAGAGDQYQYQSLKTHLEQIKTDVEQVRINQRATGGQQPCPEVDSSCLNKTLFFVIIAAQSVVLIIVVFLKKGSDKAKFY